MEIRPKESLSPGPAHDALRRPRHWVLVLGDQLDAKSAAFDGFDPKLDAVWMAEVAEESTHVWTHKARIALFLAAMRHFRDALRERGFTVDYRALDDVANAGSLAEELLATASRLTPQKLIVVQPGEWRVEQSLQTAARQLGLELEIRPDRHFLCSREEFAAHAKGRKQLRMEFFYREMRRRTGVLILPEVWQAMLDEILQRSLRLHRRHRPIEVRQTAGMLGKAFGH